MIKINRPSPPPNILQEIGQKKTRENCERYDRKLRRSGKKKKKFKFDRRVFGHRSVKEALLEAQHGKCCYCETEIPSSSHGSIEHFRPKGGSRQKKGEPVEYPGYYWLAYCWDNLLFSCDRCNNSKGSLFPLANPKKRARSHHGNVGEESPLFVDPARDDPRQHIRFREAAAVGCTEAGRQTIDGIGLQKRRSLEEDRMKHLAPLKRLRDILLILQDARKATLDASKCARQQIEEAMRPDAEYSAMMMDCLQCNAE